MGEVERAEVAARGSSTVVLPAGEDRPGEDVRLGRDRERQRADREQQPPDAQAPRRRRRPRRDWRRPRRAGAPTGTEMLGSPPSRNRVPRQPMLNVTPRIERGRAQRAEPGERHLAERQLAGPAGEHGHRDRAHREGEDRRPGLVVRRLVGRRAAARSAPRAARARRRAAACAAPTRSRAAARAPAAIARREREALAAAPVVGAADPRDEHQHDEEQHELHEAGLGREVEERAPGRGCRSTIAPTTAAGTTSCRRSARRPARAAASRARSCTSSAERLVGGVEDDRDRADRNPAIVQTPVDTILGLMPVRRARSEFVAAARTASPNAVWPSSHHSPTRDDRHDDRARAAAGR